VGTEEGGTLLDERRRVVFTNAAGEALLGNGFQIADDRLSAAFKSDRRGLHAALAKIPSPAADDFIKAPSPILIQRPGKARALSVYVLPVHAPHDRSRRDRPAPGEAAKLLGIAKETARTTLKRVFAKVGVSRQSELSALLAKLVLR
jgi:hypothetical protein